MRSCRTPHRTVTAESTPPNPLGARFDAALQLASELHRTQLRKGSAVPYLGHLLGVAAIVIDAGGSEDEAIAALLHDAVEDQGGEPTLAMIQERFGDHVAKIVAACSDTDVTPKPPWRARKEAYLGHLESATADVLLVSASDKLYNARAILADLRQVGDELWERFNEGRDSQLWYYRSLADIFERRLGGPVARELAETVAMIQREVKR
jgi:(p)ppGpp synthase/HD superfamily hydrolase